MAVTSIWPIKGRVDKVINYARNPEKTHDKEKLSELHEIEGVVEYAADEMKTEKRAHGEDTRSIASMAFSFDKKAVKNAEKMEAEKHEFLLYSEEELEELLDEKEKKDNEEA